MEIVTLGIDLAKNIFALHGVDAAGEVVLQRPAVKRAKLLELTAGPAPCRIGMEACSGAHHWAREMTRQGHAVRLIAPKFVAPYRMSGKRGKNDAADAAAICEAVSRPATRCVPVKSISRYANCSCTVPGKAIRAAHRTHQPHPRPAVRAGHRPAAEGRHHSARTDPSARRPARPLQYRRG